VIQKGSTLVGDGIGHYENGTTWTRVPCYMVTDREMFECRDRLWLWMKNEVYKIRVDTWNELFARILDAAARIRKREDQLRRTTRDLQTRDVMCIEVDGGIFERLL
jgi:hypothetical protein